MIKKNILCTICARKGSKGLKKLIEWLKKDNNIKNYKPDNYNI